MCITISCEWGVECGHLVFCSSGCVGSDRMFEIVLRSRLAGKNGIFIDLRLHSVVLKQHLGHLFNVCIWESPPRFRLNCFEPYPLFRKLKRTPFILPALNLILILCCLLSWRTFKFFIPLLLRQTTLWAFDLIRCFVIARGRAVRVSAFHDLFFVSVPFRPWLQQCQLSRRGGSLSRRQLPTAGVYEPSWMLCHASGLRMLSESVPGTCVRRRSSRCCRAEGQWYTRLVLRRLPLPALVFIHGKCVLSISVKFKFFVFRT